MVLPASITQIIGPPSRAVLLPLGPARSGGGCGVEEVVGADFVQYYGGTVVLADLIAGHSTTATIKKIGTR